MKYALIVILLVAVIYGCTSTQNKGYKDINVNEFKALMNNDNIVVLDVRTPEETAEGIIKGAQEIDYKADGFEGQIDLLDKEKTYLVYCRSGGRSSKTTNMMAKKGFKNVYNLLGGYKAWSKE